MVVSVKLTWAANTLIHHLLNQLKRKAFHVNNMILIDVPLNMNSTHYEEKSNNDRPSRSQPKISRNTFMNTRSEKDEFTDHFR